MRLNKAEHSLQFLQEYNNLIISIKEEVLLNKDYVIISKKSNEECIIKVVPKKIESSFSFCVLASEYYPNGSNFNINKIPSSSSTNNGVSAWYKSHVVLQEFKRWIHLIIQYTDFEVVEDTILDDYENDIFDNGLKIFDDDAEEKAFDFEKQILLLKFLHETKLLLESENKNEELNSAINEIEELKSDITRLPKNEVMRRLSSIFAKTKKFGLEVFKKVIEKFIVDFITNHGDKIPAYFEKLIKLMSHLPS